MTVAAVQLWGTEIGAVSLADDESVASFEYEPDFAAAGIELSPLRMPVTPGHIYRFPGWRKPRSTAFPAFSPTPSPTVSATR
jgi:serine/threonine-protein kinase HipA